MYLYIYIYIYIDMIYCILYIYIYIYTYTLKFVIQELHAVEETSQPACTYVSKARFTRPHGVSRQRFTRPSRRVED